MACLTFENYVRNGIGIERGESRPRWTVTGTMTLKRMGIALIFATGLLCLGCLILLIDRGGVILGTLHGESFYRGYSTSAWKREITNYWILRRNLDSSVPLSIPSIITERDPRAVPVLTELLEDEDDQICFEACNALHILGPKAKQAVPALCKLMQHPNVYHRRNAANALTGIISSDSKDVMPILIAGLEDTDPWVSYCNALALGKLGAGASDAVPALIELLKSPRAELDAYPAPGGSSWKIGDAVARSLEQIDPEAAEKAGTGAFSNRWQRK